MADMYGAVRSNWFKVNDVAAFKTWFYENCNFGDDIAVWEGEDNRVAFGGYEQYPNAWPRRDTDEQWELQDFAAAVREHLAPGESMRVLAAGHEKLRYVEATHLHISHDDAVFTNLYEGN